MKLTTIYKKTPTGVIKVRMKELKPGDVFKKEDAKGFFTVERPPQLNNGLWSVTVKQNER